ncbi:MAG: carbamoyltransferase HypF [Nitrospirae bacterium]|nr:MAG: carbamoyltransferase HypF [Nitrospirota bacterium]
MKRYFVKIRGRVQGVGFRPFVYNLAKKLDLKGYVNNSSKGVTIDIEGNRVDEFLKRLKESPPPLSEIEEIRVEALAPRGYKDFSIVKSKEEGSFTHVSPDVSICDDCLSEMLDPSDRRFLYPFINCTNCGPRYSITLSLPYDRPNTTMKVFSMCEECLREYEDPGNRRFHAQPNACPECGPSVEFRLLNPQFKALTGDDPIENTIAVIRAGGVVAIKGLGGFHIACDAFNEEVVERLRQRKRKSNKPFALMAPELSHIEPHVYVDDEGRSLLESNRRPIVLFKRKSTCKIAPSVAPGNSYLGFMLPYTPLHYLLFYYPSGERKEPNFSCLVMTSGNLKEEPIVHENHEALTRLKELVDALLLHNRDIFMRVDDSVIKEGVFIRRARGYVPEPIMLGDEGPEVLAVGADLKNTFTLTKERYAIMSQHIGDMENYETLRFFEEVLENLKSLYRIEPVHIAADLHPAYLSRQWAESQSLPVTFIQHHHAHAAAVMAEHGLKGPVFGVILDGTGYGPDGTLWGAEVLLVDRTDFRRLAHFEPVVLPGGERAIKEPWRVAVSVLKNAFGIKTEDVLKRLGFYERIGKERVNLIEKLIDRPDFSPLSTGAGRLFDAVASILGLVDQNTYEAEAPIRLESLIRDGIEDGYGFTLREGNETFVLSFSQTVREMVEDFFHSEGIEIISTKFHNTVVDALTELLVMLSEKHRVCKNRVVLSGGVFQNTYLLRRFRSALEERGFEVFFHRRVPPNDACISLGQAYILRHRIGENFKH